MTFLNGGAGHTYGAVGIWPWYNPSVDPELKLDWSDVTWDQALTSIGSEHMAHVLAYFESIEWWRPEPARDQVFGRGGVA